MAYSKSAKAGPGFYLLVLCLVITTTYVPFHSVSHVDKSASLSHLSLDHPHSVNNDQRLSDEHLGARTLFIQSMFESQDRSSHLFDELLCNICLNLSQVDTGLVFKRDRLMLSIIRVESNLHALLVNDPSHTFYFSRAPPTIHTS